MLNTKLLNSEYLINTGPAGVQLDDLNSIIFVPEGGTPYIFGGVCGGSCQIVWLDHSGLDDYPNIENNIENRSLTHGFSTFQSFYRQRNISLSGKFLLGSGCDICSLKNELVQGLGCLRGKLYFPNCYGANRYLDVVFSNLTFGSFDNTFELTGIGEYYWKDGQSNIEAVNYTGSSGSLVVNNLGNISAPVLTINNIVGDAEGLCIDYSTCGGDKQIVIDNTITTGDEITIDFDTGKAELNGNSLLYSGVADKVDNGLTALKIDFKPVNIYPTPNFVSPLVNFTSLTRPQELLTGSFGGNFIVSEDYLRSISIKIRPSQAQYFQHNVEFVLKIYTSPSKTVLLYTSDTKQAFIGEYLDSLDFLTTETGLDVSSYANLYWEVEYTRNITSGEITDGFEIFDGTLVSGYQAYLEGVTYPGITFDTTFEFYAQPYEIISEINITEFKASYSIENRYLSLIS